MSISKSLVDPSTKPPSADPIFEVLASNVGLSELSYFIVISIWLLSYVYPLELVALILNVTGGASWATELSMSQDKHGLVMHELAG